MDHSLSTGEVPSSDSTSDVVVAMSADISFLLYENTLLSIIEKQHFSVTDIGFSVRPFTRFVIEAHLAFTSFQELGLLNNMLPHKCELGLEINYMYS